MKCEKCGAQLHPDQKVCIVCGTRTIAGGGFTYNTDIEKAWRPSRNMIAVVLGLLAIFTVLMIARGMRVTPPDETAKAWMEALIQRQVGKAHSYVTEDYEKSLVTNVTDMNALSDTYYEAAVNNRATYTVSKPVYSRKGTVAKVSITFDFPDRRPSIPIDIELVKQGRQWRIDKAS